MQICIINCGRSRESRKLDDVSKALSRGLEGQGHSVRILNAYVDTDQRLSYYDYIIVGTESIGFLSAKVPEVLPKFLKEVPGATGKRCFAFNLGSLRSGKQLINAMKAMEGEGMFVNASMTIKNAAEAEALGKRLNVKRN